MMRPNTDAPDAARAWLDRAAEWAAEADDPSLTANVLGFKGHLAWLAREVGPLVGLSRAARRVPGAHPAEWAFNAYQEARGHAMGGDRDAADRTLDEAAGMWVRAAEHSDPPPPWSYYHSPAFSLLQRGLVNRFPGCGDARRAHRAAEYITAGLAGLPEDMRHAEWVGEYVYHLAVAHIHAGEPEQACTATAAAAHIARVTGSGEVALRVRRLHARLAATWPTLPAVADLADQL